MKNILLLSGMDGTGILFRPFINKLNNTYHIAVYDFNIYDNQDLSHQADKIANFTHENFGDKPFTIVFESYPSLLVSYLLKLKLNIEKIYIVCGFLVCPSILAKFGYLFNPVWANDIPKKLLVFLLFHRWSNDELIELFYKALAIITKPDVLPLFKKRLNNIAHTKLPVNIQQSSIPCVYLSASHDYLVNKQSGLMFKELFSDIQFIQIDGTHFLLQTNPDFLANQLNHR